jgi:phosphatidylinositol glycan class M
MSTFFKSPSLVFSAAALLRVVLLFYGLYQDAHSAVKYTDIDYMVFTDAARFVSRGHSPYARDTYRYTPLLAWMLLPTAWDGPLLFSSGKVLFAISDLVAGWLLVRVLRSEYGMSESRALKYASIWLLNPMVATISTRGSSEGLLGVMVMTLLWAITRNKISLAGALLGLGVHFKIYPFIYGPSMIWWLDAEHDGSTSKGRTTTPRSTSPNLIDKISSFITPSRVTLTVSALSTFSALNLSMYILYGLPFMQHTYLHHLTRIDHRHNFSPYNTLLYLSAAEQSPLQLQSAQEQGIHFESLAFLPQLFLSAVAIPIVLAKRSLPGTMLAQTFAFVAFNKVCTSQVCCPCFATFRERGYLTIIW